MRLIGYVLVFMFLSVLVYAAFDATSNYPASLDDSSSLYDISADDTLKPEHHDVLADAIIKIETKLGIGDDNPASSGEVLISDGANSSEWRALVNGDIPDSIDANAITIRSSKVTKIAPTDNYILKWDNALDSLRWEIDVGIGDMLKADVRDSILEVFTDSSVSKLGQTITASEMGDSDHGDFTYSGGTATLDADVVSTTEIANADHGDFTYSSGSATLDADVVGAAEIADGDYGNFTFSDGTATIDNTSVTSAMINNDAITVDKIGDGDHGDFTYSSGSATLDANTVAASELDESTTITWSGQHTYTDTMWINDTRIVFMGSNSGIDSLGYAVLDSIKMGSVVIDSFAVQVDSLKFRVDNNWYKMDKAVAP